KDMTEKIKIEEELKLAEQIRQKDILETEEKSRSMIGMELHDNVNQLLVASRLYLERVEPSSDKSNDHLKTSIGILGRALEEIRKLSASLVTPLFNKTSLKDLIENLPKNYELINTVIDMS